MLMNRVCTTYTVYSCTLILNTLLIIIWDPHLVKDIVKLEDIQRFAIDQNNGT